MQGDTIPLLGQSIGEQQHRFAQRLEHVNKPGNLEGLFARHVIGDDSALPFQWQVSCLEGNWLTQCLNRAAQTHIAAALGFELYHAGDQAPTSIISAFEQGMTSLCQRDPFPEDRVSFAYQPTTYLGLALGSVAIGSRGSACRDWLSSTLQKRLNQEMAPFQRLLYTYIGYHLTGNAIAVTDLSAYRSATDFVALLWAIGRSAARIVEPVNADVALQQEALRLALTQDASALDASHSAIMWRTVNDILKLAVAEVILSRPYVGVILRRFEAAMRRWRWDEETRVRTPVRWTIRSEREVQDILWLILRSIFDDVLDEETLPKFGHSTYRADFGIPSLRLLIEVKYVRQANDFKTIEKEILEDTVAYLQSTERYDRILVFIYDHSASVQMHEDTVRDLRRLAAIEDVVIVSRPSQIPLAGTNET